MRSRVLLLLFSAGLATGAIAAARSQTPVPQRFTTGTDLVRVDVSVVDRKGEPVRDLKASDFTILENGKPQAIEHFQQIDLPVAPAAPVSWMRDVASDVTRNGEVVERRLVVILMDDAMVPFDLSMLKTARKIAQDVVERLGPDDLAAVMFTRDNRRAQNFTHDRARLLEAIDSFDSAGFVPEPGAEMSVQYVQYFVDSLQTLLRAVERLASIPERRKALVFVSTGVPVLIDTSERATSPHSYLNWLARSTMDKAQRGSVNIHTVDPGGLDGLRMMMLRRNTRTESFIIEQIEESPIHYRSFLRAMAENTGGRAFVDTNEFGSRVAQIFRETGSFYLLGYRPENQKADGRFRRLQVRVNRPNVTVWARNGYYAPTPPTAAPGAIPAADEAALAGFVPNTDVPLELAAAAFAISGTPEAAVILTLGAQAPRTAAAGATSTERVDVLLAAFSSEGDERGSLRLATDVSLTPDATYEILGRLDLRPGRYELRASASGLAMKSGSVYAYLTVPDFAGEPLSMSDIVMSAAPARISGNGSAAADLAPFPPTTRRVLATTDQVTAFLKVYEGGKRTTAAAAVVIRLTDSADKVVAEETRTLPADAFSAGRGADVRFDLPVSRLTPGSYLLSIDVTAESHKSRRVVRFEIR